MLALNSRETGYVSKASQMPKRSSASISKKAHAKAEADFTTWLMMAKLGGFDDLPPTAQTWLMSYRTRLEAKVPEAEATAVTIREMYAAYYADMGGEGEAPPIAPIEARPQAEVVDLKTARRTRSAGAAAVSTSERPKRSLPPLLIFVGLVAALAAIKFAFGW
jgi:hypothetical protein